MNFSDGISIMLDIPVRWDASPHITCVLLGMTTGQKEKSEDLRKRVLEIAGVD